MAKVVIEVHTCSGLNQLLNAVRATRFAGLVQRRLAKVVTVVDNDVLVERIVQSESVQEMSQLNLSLKKCLDNANAPVGRRASENARVGVPDFAVHGTLVHANQFDGLRVSRVVVGAQ